MVIIRTSATEVSIQAVSPEFGVHFSSTASLGSALDAQAGGAASGAAAGAAAGAGACAISANEVPTGATLRNRPRSIAKARPTSPERNGFLNVIVGSSCPMACGLQRRSVGLAGADAHGVVERDYEDLAVTDLAGLGRAGDRLNDLVDQGGIDSHLDLHLGQEVHCVLSAAVDLGVPLLAPIPFDLRDRQAVDADRSQRITHLVKLERLDHRHDDFHGFFPLRPAFD